MNPVSGLGAPYAPYSPSARPAPRFTQVLPGLHFAGLGDNAWVFDAAPKAGYYAEGGYTYYYDPSMGGSIRIVRSPRGSGGQYVQVGSSAYNAIFAQIKSGVAKPVSQPSAPVSSSSARRSYTPAPVSSGSVPSASTTPASSGWSTYAPWLVLGAGAVVAVGLVLTAPKRQA